MRDWLVNKRIKKGFSQKKVSELIAISQPSYCNIENGERRPSVETAKKIAEALGFDWTRFYEDESETV